MSKLKCKKAVNGVVGAVCVILSMIPIIVIIPAYVLFGSIIEVIKEKRKK